MSTIALDAAYEVFKTSVFNDFSLDKWGAELPMRLLILQDLIE